MEIQVPSVKSCVDWAGDVAQLEKNDYLACMMPWVPSPQLETLTLRQKRKKDQELKILLRHLECLGLVWAAW